MGNVQALASEVHLGGEELPGIPPDAFAYQRIKELVSNRGGRDIADVLDDCRAVLEPAPRAELRKPKFNRITAAELATGRYDVSYLIDGILVEGQPAGIIGPQKALKTSLVLDLAIALGSGGQFLGRFPVHRPRRVCVFSAESGWSTIQETCQRICQATNRRLEDTSIVFSDTVPHVGERGHMRQLEMFLRDEGAQVAFFDPWYLMAVTGGDEGSIFAMGALLRELSELCGSVGVTPIIVHHTRRGVPTTDDPPELSDASWAGMSEFLRQWILVKRRNRYEPGTGQHELLISVGGSAGHGGLWALNVSEGTRQNGATRFWDVKLQEPSELDQAQALKRERDAEQRQRNKLEADKSKLLAAVAKCPAGESMNILRGNAGLSGNRAKVALNALLDSGDIETCDLTKSNRSSPYLGYRLADRATA